jgi:hypothetical protein
MISPENSRPDNRAVDAYVGFAALGHGETPNPYSANESDRFNAAALGDYRHFEYWRFNPTPKDYEWAFDECQTLFKKNSESLRELANFISNKNGADPLTQDDFDKIVRGNDFKSFEMIADQTKFEIRIGYHARDISELQRSQEPGRRPVAWRTTYPVSQMTIGLYSLLAKVHNTHSRIAPAGSTDPAQRVTQAMFEEWYNYTSIANDIAPDVWFEKFSCGTLANYSLLDLKTRLKEEKLPADQTLRIFAQFRNQFLSVYQWRVEDRKRESLRKIGKSESNNNKRGKELLADTRYRTFAENQTYGVTLELEDIKEINDALFAVCTQGVEDAAMIYGEAQCNVWGYGVTKNIADTVRPKNFNGRLTDFRVIHLPFSDSDKENYLQQFTKSDEIDRESVARVGVVADMYSSGRGKVGESLRDIVIYTRNIESPDKRLINMSVRGEVSGDKVMQYLVRESYGRATLELIKGMSKPLSAGLPTLGNKR